MAVSIHKMKIARIISRQVVTVTPDTPVIDAVAIMARSRISCLVVADRSEREEGRNNFRRYGPAPREGQ